MTDLATTQTGSPDRKRSLDRDSISDAGSVVERSSRYKRQATDDHGSTTELSAISLAISDDEEVTPLHYAEDDARAGASKPAPGGNTGGTGSASGTSCGQGSQFEWLPNQSLWVRVEYVVICKGASSYLVDFFLKKKPTVCLKLIDNVYGGKQSPVYIQDTKYPARAVE
ncbi:hypothetical protein BASA61_004342 [Batrachochytrium salamandrivorans]|nr:hypothetical protein BASA61_004342 [Batrachochytrium salamandrivorans]